MGDLDAKLILAVEDLQSLAALGDQTVTVDQNTVDVKGKGHVLGLLDLLGLDGLNLGCQQSTSRLDWWHARPGGPAGDRITVWVVHRGQTRLAGLPPGNGQRGAEGVARSSPVLHGGHNAEVVHVLCGLRDGGTRSWHLDWSSAIVIRDGDGLLGLALGLVAVLDAILGAVGDGLGVLNGRHVGSCERREGGGIKKGG